MDALTDMQSEITEYLKIGGCPHLSDTLSLIPVINQEAVYNMICDLQYKRVQKKVIAMQVCEDVAKMTEGKPEEAVFSKAYLLEL